MDKPVQDFTLDSLRNYHDEDKLGSLSFPIPIKPYGKEPDVLNGRVRLELSTLFDEATQMDPEYGGLVAACVLGKVLFRNFESPYAGMVTDLDLMFITESGKGPEIVIPKKTIKPKTRRVSAPYTEHDVIVSAAVHTTTPVRRNRGLIAYVMGAPRHEFVEGAIPLHISYRSEHQFLNGIAGRPDEPDAGDSVSKSVARYGIAILNQEGLSRLVADYPSRNLLHHAEWKVDDRGKLQGDVLDRP